MESTINRTRVLEKYYRQPAVLPQSLREEINGEGTIYYAFVDLDPYYQFASSWLILLPKELIYATEKEGGWETLRVAYVSLGKVVELAASGHRQLYFEGRDGECLLKVVYSLRQSANMSTLIFLAREACKKGELPSDEASNADEFYLRHSSDALLEVQASVSGKQQDVVWRLLKFLIPYKKSLAFGFAGAILMTLVSLLPAYLTGYIIDQVIKPFQEGQLSKSKAWDMAYVTILGLVATYVLRELFAWMRLRNMTVLGEYVAKDLRDKVYSHLQKLSMNFFNSKQTGSIISRVGSDTDRIWDFIAFGVVEVTTSVVMLLGLSIVLIYLDPTLGLIVSLPVPFLLWSIYAHGQYMQKLFLKAWRKWSDLTDCLSDTIPGIRVVKSFNKEDNEIEKFTARNSSVVKEFNNIHISWTKFWPFLMLSIQGIVIAVWMVGIPRVLEHVENFAQGNVESGLSPGVFISFVLYLGMFVYPIEIIGQMARMINRATSSAHRVFEILDTEPDIVSKNQARTGELVGRVEFKNVSFSYDGVKSVLKDVSFAIEPGQMVGLVGPSGSGKTTITNLVSRFYDASKGQILVDGIDIKSVNLGSYRSQMGVVLQEPYLFHGTILDNIRYAEPNASPMEVIEAARSANAHDFICRLPHGYDTMVGERGHTLSGGERQRISIARAILCNPRILILDEATSSVDTESERKIQRALQKLVKGRTTIAIAHRLSTLTGADKILVLKNGKLCEQGNHHDLMNIDQGIYRGLVDMQSDFQQI